jgi:hypothetical protein
MNGHAIAALRMRLVGELTVVNKRMRQKRAA